MRVMKKIARHKESEYMRRLRKAEKHVARENERHEYAKRQATRMELFNLQLVFLTALRELYRFGGDRMMRVIKKALSTSDCIDGGYVKLTELKQQIKEETKYSLEIKSVAQGLAYEEQQTAVDQVSTIYLWALHETEAFGRKRLAATYQKCADICVGLKEGKRNIEDMAKAFKQMRTGLDFTLKGYR